jgi:hypothetical protein
LSLRISFEKLGQTIRRVQVLHLLSRSIKKDMAPQTGGAVYVKWRVLFVLPQGKWPHRELPQLSG